MNGRVGFGEPAGDPGGEEDGWMRSEARGSRRLQIHSALHPAWLRAISDGRSANLLPACEMIRARERLLPEVPDHGPLGQDRQATNHS